MVKSYRQRVHGSTRRGTERIPERDRNYTPPPLPPGNEDSWELQYCKWWGWNWVKKENFEITKYERQDINRCNCECSRPGRSFPPSSPQPQPMLPPKKLDKNSNCLRDLCSCLFSKHRQRESLQRLYSTPSNSIIYQEAVCCSNKDKGVESFSCLEMHRNLSRRDGKDSKYKQRSAEKSRCRCKQKSEERECKCCVCKGKTASKEDSSTSTPTQEEPCFCCPRRKSSDNFTCKCKCLKETKKADRISQTNHPKLITTHAQTTKAKHQSKNIAKCKCVHLVCHCCCHCCCKINGSEQSTTSTDEGPKIQEPEICSCCKCNNCSPNTKNEDSLQKKYTCYTLNKPHFPNQDVPCKDYPPYQGLQQTKEVNTFTQLKQDLSPPNESANQHLLNQDLQKSAESCFQFKLSNQKSKESAEKESLIPQNYELQKPNFQFKPGYTKLKKDVSTNQQLINTDSKPEVIHKDYPPYQELKNSKQPIHSGFQTNPMNQELQKSTKPTDICFEANPICLESQKSKESTDICYQEPQPDCPPYQRLKIPMDCFQTIENHRKSVNTGTQSEEINKEPTNACFKLDINRSVHKSLSPSYQNMYEKSNPIQPHASIPEPPQCNQNKLYYLSLPNQMCPSYQRKQCCCQFQSALNSPCDCSCCLKKNQTIQCSMEPGEKMETTKSDILYKYYSKKLGEEFFDNSSKCSSLPDPIEVDEDIKYLESLGQRVKKEMESRIMLDAVYDQILFKTNCQTFETESTNSDAHNIEKTEEFLNFEDHFMTKVEALVRRLLEDSNSETGRFKRNASPPNGESAKRFKQVDEMYPSSEESFGNQVNNFNNLFEKMDEIAKKSKMNVAKIQGVIRSLPRSHRRRSYLRKNSRSSSRKKDKMETLHEIAVNDEEIVIENSSDNWSSLSSRSRAEDETNIGDVVVTEIDEVGGQNKSLRSKKFSKSMIPVKKTSK